MTVTFDIVCYVLAAICFILAAGWQSHFPRWNPIAVGLFLLTLALLVP